MKKIALFSSFLLLASCGFLQGETPTEPTDTEGEPPAAAEPAAPVKDTCEKDADCGNGRICADEFCETTCAGIGEKCSDTRVCCFEDTNENDETNAECTATDEDPELRCRVTEEEAPAGGDEGADDAASSEPTGDEGDEAPADEGDDDGTTDDAASSEPTGDEGDEAPVDPAA